MSQDTTNSNTTTLGWDPTDPHGINPHDDAHHGHFVADYRMQVTILAILLAFTVLTVGFYNLEQWVEGSFGILLPKWVNIAGVMSIAVVKAVLVGAFFMQLKYDKVLNTFVILFCLFCVALFLGFAMIDLDDRGLVDPIKAGEIQAGGTGVGLNAAPADPRFAVDLAPKINTGGMSLVQYARLNGNKHHPGLNAYRDNPDMDEADFWSEFYGSHATHRDELDESNYFESLGFAHHDAVSTANASHPRHGITPGLFSDVDPAEDHSAGGEHATESHDDGH
jgi:caa(3)-type oxidase subunit IV